MIPVPLTPTFQKFVDERNYHVLLKHQAFRVNPALTDITKMLSTTKTNLIFLPDNIALLHFWLKQLRKTSLSWIAIVPQLWTTPGIHNFLQNYQTIPTKYSCLLQNTNFTVSRNCYFVSATLPSAYTKFSN